MHTVVKSNHFAAQKRNLGKQALPLAWRRSNVHPERLVRIAMQRAAADDAVSRLVLDNQPAKT